MAWQDWIIEILERLSPNDMESIRRFLAQGGLGFDSPNPDVIVVARDSASESIVGTGALSGNVLKQIRVDDEHRSTGLFAEIVTCLIDEAAQRGIFHVFVFTKLEAAPAFRGLGFNPVASTGRVSLLEMGRPDFKEYLENLSRHYTEPGPIGSIVMNCNPFTLGHRYLVEKASIECKTVHLFVVSEDRSLFPTKIRVDLVRKGTWDLPNVIVHEGGPYIISGATFPNYFLRQPGEATGAQAELDATIFGKDIAPTLGITERFLGEEPIDETTKQYNAILESCLPSYGVSPHIIPRLKHDGTFISASAVRKAMIEDRWDIVKKLVPRSTLDYLLSEEGKSIVDKARAIPECACLWPKILFR